MENTTKEIFNNFYRFHNTIYPTGDKLYSPELHNNSQFGVLELNCNKCEDNAQENMIFDIAFSIDNSGSMSELYKDKMSKMDYVKHTIKSILRVLSEKTNITVNIYLQTFNNEVEEIIDFITITPENLDEINKKIANIYPCGYTNLKKPIEKMSEIMYSRRDEYLNNIRVHIELTDGHDTSDNSNEDIINCVNNEYKNIFIGFGERHNSILLDSMAYFPNDEYRFIDRLELCSLVYGEIIHNIINISAEMCTINIENGKIYNWYTNEWTEYFYIGDISYGMEKIYHIQSNNPKEFKCKLNGIYSKDIIDFSDEFVELPNLETEDGEVCVIDHTKYMYRQMVQELLFEVKEKIIKYKIDTNKEQKKILKKYYENIEKYMNDNNLNDDLFWKLLLDDIYITYRSLDTEYGHMYTTSRHNSQGRQDTYTVNNIDDTINNDIQLCISIPKLKRNNYFNSIENENTVEYNDILNHNVLDNTQSPYTNTDLMDTITNVSSWM
jgi:hypothetical protein